MAINITRLSGTTEEQVISNKAAYLVLVLPELTTTGVIDVRNARGALVVDTVGNIGATASSSGGSLADDQYFINVVAVDADGNISAEGTEDNDTVTAGGGAGSVAVTWDAPTTGATPAGFRVYVGVATGVYDGYFNVAAGATGFTVVSTSYDVSGDGPGAVSSSANANVVHSAAAGVAQSGKLFAGALLDKGITVKLAVDTDICAIIWEAA